jgi:glutamate--cysteine ligase
VLDAIAGHGNSFFRFALAQSQAHQAHFAALPLDQAALAAYQAEAAKSLTDQAAIEAADAMDFDSFVASYLGQSIAG